MENIDKYQKVNKCVSKNCGSNTLTKKLTCFFSGEDGECEPFFITVRGAVCIEVNEHLIGCSVVERFSVGSCRGRAYCCYNTVSSTGTLDQN